MRYVQVQAYECTQAVDILIHGQQHFETENQQQSGGTRATPPLADYNVNVIN